MVTVGGMNWNEWRMTPGLIHSSPFFPPFIFHSSPFPIHPPYPDIHIITSLVSLLYFLYFVFTAKKRVYLDESQGQIPIGSALVC